MAVDAYVLVEVEPGKAREAAAKIQGLSGVKSAVTVMGPYDIVAHVSGKDVKSLGDLAIAKIQGVKGVKRTLTCMHC